METFNGRFYDENLQWLNLSPVKPIDIQACQEECANIFGFDFDIKFCKMPEAVINDREKEVAQKSSNDHQTADLLPKFDNCLGLSCLTE